MELNTNLAKDSIYTVRCLRLRGEGVSLGVRLVDQNLRRLSLRYDGGRGGSGDTWCWLQRFAHDGEKTCHPFFGRVRLVYHRLKVVALLEEYSLGFFRNLRLDLNRKPLIFPRLPNCDSSQSQNNQSGNNYQHREVEVSKTEVATCSHCLNACLPAVIVVIP